MSLLWNLDIFLCIRLEELEDLCWILSTWNLKFLIQTEQATALLWTNCTFYFLENFRTFKWSYSSELFWVVPSESTPANKNMFEVSGKKTLGLSQLMLFEYFYDQLGINFSSLWRSLFFSKASGLSYKQHIQQVCAGLLQDSEYTFL